MLVIHRTPFHGLRIYQNSDQCPTLEVIPLNIMTTNISALYRIRTQNHCITQHQIASNCAAVGNTDSSYSRSHASLIHVLNEKKKAKSVPLQVWSGPEGSSKLRFPDFMTTVRLSALRTGRLYPKKSSWYSLLLEAESTPGP